MQSSVSSRLSGAYLRKRFLVAICVLGDAYGEADVAVDDWWLYRDDFSQVLFCFCCLVVSCVILCYYVMYETRFPFWLVVIGFFRENK